MKIVTVISVEQRNADWPVKQSQVIVFARGYRNFFELHMCIVVSRNS